MVDSEILIMIFHLLWPSRALRREPHDQTVNRKLLHHEKHGVQGLSNGRTRNPESLDAKK